MTLNWDIHEWLMLFWLYNYWYHRRFHFRQIYAVVLFVSLSVRIIQRPLFLRPFSLCFGKRVASLSILFFEITLITVRWSSGAKLLWLSSLFPLFKTILYTSSFLYCALILATAIEQDYIVYSNSVSTFKWCFCVLVCLTSNSLT